MTHARWSFIATALNFNGDRALAAERTGFGDQSRARLDNDDSHTLLEMPQSISLCLPSAKEVHPQLRPQTGFASAVSLFTAETTICDFRTTRHPPGTLQPCQLQSPPPVVPLLMCVDIFVELFHNRLPLRRFGHRGTSRTVSSLGRPNHRCSRLFNQIHTRRFVVA